MMKSAAAQMNGLKMVESAFANSTAARWRRMTVVFASLVRSISLGPACIPLIIARPSEVCKVARRTSRHGPFERSGGAASVLLLHGFSGAPAEMRELGDRLHSRGYGVIAP